MVVLPSLTFRLFLAVPLGYIWVTLKMKIGIAHNTLITQCVWLPKSPCLAVGENIMIKISAVQWSGLTLFWMPNLKFTSWMGSSAQSNFYESSCLIKLSLPMPTWNSVSCTHPPTQLKYSTHSHTHGLGFGSQRNSSTGVAMVCVSCIIQTPLTSFPAFDNNLRDKIN